MGEECTCHGITDAQILRAENGDGEADLLGSEVGDPRAWEKKQK